MFTLYKQTNKQASFRRIYISGGEEVGEKELEGEAGEEGKGEEN